MKSEEYLRQAEVCEAEARRQTAAALRRQFEFLAKQWREFAVRIALIEKSKARLVQGQAAASPVVASPVVASPVVASSVVASSVVQSPVVSTPHGQD